MSQGLLGAVWRVGTYQQRTLLLCARLFQQLVVLFLLCLTGRSWLEEFELNLFWMCIRILRRASSLFSVPSLLNAESSGSSCSTACVNLRLPICGEY